MSYKNKLCVVLDLDDTLYLERDYQLSGFLAVEEYCNKLYGVDVSGLLLKLNLSGFPDVFEELCNVLSIPAQCKQSFLWVYRNHVPRINLTNEVKIFLGELESNSVSVCILTDGRSVTQRLKLNSLGLINIPVFISEEWGECKPGFKRFEVIQAEYCSDLYCYVGDNPQKDFLAPNKLGWITIGLIGGGRNIHSQNLDGLSQEYLPNYWVKNLNEILTVVFPN